MTDHAPPQDRFDVTALDPDQQGRLRRIASWPFHMLPALAGYPFLLWPNERRAGQVLGQGLRRYNRR